MSIVTLLVTFQFLSIHNDELLRLLVGYSMPFEWYFLFRFLPFWSRGADHRSATSGAEGTTIAMVEWLGSKLSL